MNRKWKERTKSCILIVLILTSVLQVGILWNGFPAFFGAGSPVSSQKLYETARKDIFIPYRVSACDDSQNHWIIPADDENYGILWNETKYYLKKIISGSPGKITDEDSWSDLVTKKAFTLEFKSGMDTALVAWFLGSQATSTDGPEKVYKILISPWDDISMNSIYVYDGTRVFKYNFQMGSVGREKYEGIISSFQSNSRLRVNGITGRDEERQFSIKPGVLGIIQGSKNNKSKYSSFSNLTCTIPAYLDYESTDLLNIAKRILGNGVYSYDRYVEPDDNTIELKTVNDIYRLYSDGLLEYKYLQAQAQDSGGAVQDAFKNAYRFVSSINVSDTDTSIYLSGMEEKSDRYVITFDYMKGGYPIFFNYVSRTGRERLTNSITIEANGERVLSCTWIIKEFGFSREKDTYNASLRDFINTHAKTFKAIKGNKDIFVTDIVTSYVVDSEKENGVIAPSWVINTSDKNYPVPMEK